jgi:hypothetical protein
MFTIHDRIFLERCGIAAGPLPSDGTAETLRELNLPPTWSNWLMLSTAGHPEQEIDGEMEAEIQSMTAGDCGEPSYEDADENDEDDE